MIGDATRQLRRARTKVEILVDPINLIDGVEVRLRPVQTVRVLRILMQAQRPYVSRTFILERSNDTQSCLSALVAWARIGDEFALGVRETRGSGQPIGSVWPLFGDYAARTYSNPKSWRRWLSEPDVRAFTPGEVDLLLGAGGAG